MGAGLAMGMGEARRDCSERQEEKRFPKAVCAESCGGLAGGDAKSDAWSRVRGGWESQGKADGSSMLVFDGKNSCVGSVVIFLVGTRCDRRRTWRCLYRS